MKTWSIQVTQEFGCTYVVRATSAEEAWATLVRGNAECIDQMPGEIITPSFEAAIEEDP